jgi:uncharacterized protein YkwD
MHNRSRSFHLEASDRLAKHQQNLRLAIGHSSSSIQRAGTAINNQFLSLINAERSKLGKKPVKINAALNQAAQGHAADMAINDFFGHTGSAGSTVQSRVKAAKYRFAVCGENIAAGFSLPSSVVAAWMQSPVHKAAIANNLFKDIGVGYYYHPGDSGNIRYQHYWVVDFGQPMG